MTEGLLAFAREQFELASVMDDGSTLRVHLESSARQGDPEDRWRLDHQPKLPPLASHVWAYFITLSGSRTSLGMSGPGPITFRDVEAWMTVTGARLEPWELDAVLKLDRVYLNQVADEQKRRAK